ncbi:MAG: flavodoxin domain-containing protein [Planctomycetia bacterium]
MTIPRTLVICKSVHHGNTARVAGRIAEVLRAEVAEPESVPYTALDGYDLVGFGSGVSYGRFHAALQEWLRGLPDAAVARQPAFVFSTSGLSCLWRLWHRPFTRELARRGFRVCGEFHCRGFDSWGPLWFAGGINRWHPDDRDLDRAAAFARRIAAGA